MSTIVFKAYSQTLSCFDRKASLADIGGESLVIMSNCFGSANVRSIVGSLG